MSMSATCRIELENRIEDFPRFLELLESFAEQHDLPQEAVFSMHLAIDELFTNIVSYGFSDDKTHTIEIDVSYGEDALQVRMSDDGIPFDPLNEAPEPDLDASLEERRVGGVGVHFVKNLMDDVSYVYENGRNCLCLIKKTST